MTTHVYAKHHEFLKAWEAKHPEFRTHKMPGSPTWESAVNTCNEIMGRLTADEARELHWSKYPSPIPAEMIEKWAKEREANYSANERHLTLLAKKLVNVPGSAPPVTGDPHIDRDRRLFAEQFAIEKFDVRTQESAGRVSASDAVRYIDNARATWEMKDRNARDTYARKYPKAALLRSPVHPKKIPADLQVSCPRCNAGVGMYCITSSGHVTYESHRVRVAAMRKVTR